ncbi:MAG: NADH-quinone oxidoreductase subunit J [Ignavibacteria bacterium]|nr:NADH-quinone oxidoreductase subunit J [Ignavibacteria bacterium]
MNIYDLIFYLFATITVLSALAVVSTKNIIYSAYNLMLTFFGVAGLYVLLGADFLAIVQLIVYVGGILILILFGVMLTNKVNGMPIHTEVTNIIPASITIGLFAGIVLAFFMNTNWKSVTTEFPATTIQSLGKLLMNEYILIFELLGVLLLIALIGAASIARKQ